jgi:hypothetical protein
VIRPSSFFFFFVTPSPLFCVNSGECSTVLREQWRVLHCSLGRTSPAESKKKKFKKFFEHL